MIAAIVAMDKNGVIGDKNDLPWYLPADLRHFKQITDGHTVVMGRKTWQSILARLGKPLPNRRNIVITRDPSAKTDGAEFTNDIKTLLTKTDEDIFIIGGAEIFAVSLPFIQRLYITKIQAEVHGDVTFPKLNDAEWVEVSSEHHTADEKNEYDYQFVTLDRKNGVAAS